MSGAHHDMSVFQYSDFGQKITHTDRLGNYFVLGDAGYVSMKYNITLKHVTAILRDWSLITGRGGLQNGRGGHVKFYPYVKGGRKKF